MSDQTNPNKWTKEFMIFKYLPDKQDFLRIEGPGIGKLVSLRKSKAVELHDMDDFDEENPDNWYYSAVRYLFHGLPVDVDIHTHEEMLELVIDTNQISLGHTLSLSLISKKDCVRYGIREEELPF